MNPTVEQTISTNDLLSPEQLAEIQQRCDAATEGPWTWEPVGEFDGEASNAGGFTYQHIRAGYKGVADTYHASGCQYPDGTVAPLRDGNKDDANFIANAREDIPALLAHAAALQAQLDAESSLAGEWELRWDISQARLAEAEQERDNLRNLKLFTDDSMTKLETTIKEFKEMGAAEFRRQAIEAVQAMDRSGKLYTWDEVVTLLETLERSR